MSIRDTLRKIGSTKTLDVDDLKTSDHAVYLRVRELLGLGTGVLPKWAKHILANPTARDRCLVCGAETRFAPKRGRFHDYCGGGCVSKTRTVKEKRHKTNVKRYGADYRLQNAKKAAVTLITKHGSAQAAYKARSKKTKATCMGRYGVANPSQVEAIKKKIVESLARTPKSVRSRVATEASARWRSDPKRVRTARKRFATTVARRGAEDVALIVAKRRATSLERYGVPHHYQDGGVFDNFQKKAYTAKEVLVNKEVHKVRGYEGVVLKHLENQIDKCITSAKELPEIWYGYQGVERRYYVDFAILAKSGRRYLVEVKSSYTLIADIHRNLAKFRAATKIANQLGLTFVLAVASQNELTDWIPNPTLRKLAKWVS